jgi:hypothetical protein
VQYLCKRFDAAKMVRRIIFTDLENLHDLVYLALFNAELLFFYEIYHALRRQKQGVRIQRFLYQVLVLCF